MQLKILEQFKDQEDVTSSNNLGEYVFPPTQCSSEHMAIITLHASQNKGLTNGQEKELLFNCVCDKYTKLSVK